MYSLRKYAAHFKTFIYEISTIYSITIRIMCYVKVWKYIIAICSLVFRRGFLIRCAILVIICFALSLRRQRVAYFYAELWSRLYAIVLQNNWDILAEMAGRACLHNRRIFCSPEPQCLCWDELKSSKNVTFKLKLLQS